MGTNEKKSSWLGADLDLEKWKMDRTPRELRLASDAEIEVELLRAPRPVELETRPPTLYARTSDVVRGVAELVRLRGRFPVHESLEDFRRMIIERHPDGTYSFGSKFEATRNSEGIDLETGGSLEGYAQRLVGEMFLRRLGDIAIEDGHSP